MKGIILFIFISFFLFACSNEDECALYFIGDSMIANWDTESAFPNRITKNLGRDGRRIDDLYSVDISDISCEIVVLIGINDLDRQMTEEQKFLYCKKYEDVLSQLKFRRLWVISILPTYDMLKNRMIREINEGIRSNLNKYPNIIYIDCHNDFLKDGVIRNDLSRDGIHLNDYGYLRLTASVKRYL